MISRRMRQRAALEAVRGPAINFGEVWNAEIERMIALADACADWGCGPPAADNAGWGLPDWQDGDRYPTELTPPGWRWEFLRRNPLYRASWLARNAPDHVRDDLIAWDRRKFLILTWLDPREPAVSVDADSSVVVGPRRPGSRVRADKFCIYLRIIDAMAALGPGAAPAAIGRVIYAGDVAEPDHVRTRVLREMGAAQEALWTVAGVEQ